jgi:hypothetical protein
VNLQEVLKQLRLERQLLTEAILVLERLMAESAKPRRGRPPKWMSVRNWRTQINHPSK